MHLERDFFLQPTIKVAQALLGKYLVHKINHNVKIVGKIVETEAYLGVKDKASHSYNFKHTERNKAEYLVGGHIYIYLIYGIYWQLNITTQEEGIPECVLIRSLEPIDGIKEMQRKRKKTVLKELTNGPGKLCQAMGLDKKFYGIDICKSPIIYIENNPNFRPLKIVKAKRIGIDYSGIWKNKALRFYLFNNPFVSKK